MRYLSLADGRYDVELRDTDAVGNVDPTAARRTFTVRTTPPSHAFTIGKVVTEKSRGTATIRLTVPGAGTIAILKSGTTAAAKRATAGATTVTLTVKAIGKAAKTLKKKGRVTITTSIRFSPTGGTPLTKTRAVTLVRR